MSNLYFVGYFGKNNRNIGDYAIEYITKKILGEQFNDYTMYYFSRDEMDVFYDLKINREDLIFVCGHGSFGDFYTTGNDMIKKIIETFPNNKIIQLPVSIYYKNKDNYLKDREFFSNKNNFILLCRSLDETIKYRYLCSDVKFFPDMVFSLQVKKLNLVKSKFLMSLRNDEESVFRKKFPEKLRRRPFRKLINFILDVDYLIKNIGLIDENTDVHDYNIIPKNISDFKKYDYLQEILKIYQTYNTVISDRFHVCVFCYLVKTPFIMLDSIIKKSEYIMDIEYDFYFDNFRKMIME